MRKRSGFAKDVFYSDDVDTLFTDLCAVLYSPYGMDRNGLVRLVSRNMK